MADVTASGLVKVHDLPGKVAVMVRYQAKVAVFTAAVPLGAPVENLPKAKNFGNYSPVIGLDGIGDFR